jgi:hypothetical protein
VFFFSPLCRDILGSNAFQRTPRSTAAEVAKKSNPMVYYPFIYGSTVLLLGSGPFFSFFILFTVGRTPWAGKSIRRKTHTYTQNKRTQTYIPWVRFEPTSQAFEQVKTVHALDYAVTVIGSMIYYRVKNAYHLIHIWIICYLTKLHQLQRLNNVEWCEKVVFIKL